MVVPEDWDAIGLKVTSAPGTDGEASFSLSIFNPAGKNKPISPSDSTYEKVLALADACKNSGRPWTLATYILKLVAEEEWDYSVDFEYK